MILALQAGIAALRRPTVERLPERRILAAAGVLIVAAWVALLVMTIGGMGMRSQVKPSQGHGNSTMAGMARKMPVMSASSGMTTQSMAGMRGMDVLSVGSGMEAGTAIMWVLMIVAMMLPSALPAARYTWAHSLRWRRGRGMAQFVGGYLLTWFIAGAAILLVAGLLGAGGGAALIGVLCVAAAWQLTPQKLRALRDCHRPMPLSPSGWAADRAATQFGLRNGWACLRSCWAMMLVMAVTSGMAFAWMLAITALATAEKFSQRPRRSSRRVSAVLGIAAASSVMLALV